MHNKRDYRALRGYTNQTINGVVPSIILAHLSSRNLLDQEVP